MRKRLSIDDAGVSRDTVYQEIRPGAGFETGDPFVGEKLGGAEVVRNQRPSSENWGFSPAVALILRCKNTIVLVG